MIFRTPHAITFLINLHRNNTRSYNHHFIDSVQLLQKLPQRKLFNFSEIELFITQVNRMPSLNFSLEKDIPDLSGKVIIVTGGMRISYRLIRIDQLQFLAASELLRILSLRISTRFIVN